LWKVGRADMTFDYTNLSLTGMVLFIAAFLIGIKFPDWDFKMKLRHRNVLTHSPFAALVFYWLYLDNPSVEFRYFIMGFSLAVGIHLIFDIFPNGWGGGAMLQMPLIKYSFKKNTTKILLFIFIVVSLGITIKNTGKIEEVIFMFVFGIFMMFKETIKEGKIIRPIFVYTVIMVLLASFKYEEVSTFALIVYTNVQKNVVNLL